jgi:hypothetical protein
MKYCHTRTRHQPDQAVAVVDPDHGDRYSSFAFLCACTYMEDVRLLLVTAQMDTLRHIAHSHSHPTFCEHRECGIAGLRNRRPQSYNCTGVRTIIFLGSVLVTACFVRSTNANQVPRHWCCSRNCTTYICLHRLRTTTSNIHTRCLI